MTNGDKPPEPKWLFYILSFIIPLVGIILGAIYLSKPDPECKNFGKNCLIAAIAYFVVICICVILYILFYFVIFGLIFGAAAVGS